MDSYKIGKFILELRKEKNWSQETLAQKLFVDRTTVNKWENEKSEPDKDKYLLLCEIFDVTVIELLTGKRQTQKNKISIQKKFIDILKNQDTKFKKMKIAIFILTILVILLGCSFTIYYFFQNYKSIKIYEFSGKSEHHTISNGFLFSSKQRSYFKIGKIEPVVKEISIYMKDNQNEYLIYKGDPTNTITDVYGYNSFIPYDFLQTNKNIYLKIENEIINLNFVEHFINDTLIFQKKNEISEFNKTNVNEKNSFAIPPKIKNNFTCENDYCSLIINNKILTYNSPVKILEFYEEKKYFQFYVENSWFIYQENMQDDKELKFELLDGIVTCYSGDCKNALDIYEHYYDRYISFYLEE